MISLTPVLMAAVVSANVSPAAAVPLSVLRSTDGSRCETLLDGNAATSWTITENAEDEGVMLRFEQPEPMTAVALNVCGSSTFDVYINGTPASVSRALSTPQHLFFAAGKLAAQGGVSSVFVRSTSAAICISEVSFYREQTRLAVTPPRLLNRMMLSGDHQRGAMNWLAQSRKERKG